MIALAAAGALAEIEGKVPSTEAANAFLHAAQIIRSLPDRAVKHLRQHASFTSSKEKADAYREAAAIYCRHLGEPETEIVPEPAPIYREAFLFGEEVPA